MPEGATDEVGNGTGRGRHGRRSKARTTGSTVRSCFVGRSSSPSLLRWPSPSASASPGRLAAFRWVAAGSRASTRANTSLGTVQSSTRCRSSRGRRG